MRPSKSTSLQTLYPEIAQEWDQEKNAVTADLCSAKSRLEVWWKCKNGHLWSESVRNRTVDHSCCPLCRDKGSVSLPQRCRQLLRHWDYQKNDTPPNTVSIGTSRKYFWKCERCHRSFQAPVNGVVTTFFEGKDAEGHETKGNRVYAESVIWLFLTNTTHHLSSFSSHFKTSSTLCAFVPIVSMTVYRFSCNSLLVNRNKEILLQLQYGF